MIADKTHRIINNMHSPIPGQAAMRQQPINDTLHLLDARVVRRQHTIPKLLQRLAVQVLRRASLLRVADNIETAPARYGHLLEIVDVEPPRERAQPARLVLERGTARPGLKEGEAVAGEALAAEAAVFVGLAGQRPWAAGGEGAGAGGARGGGEDSEERGGAR